MAGRDPHSHPSQSGEPTFVNGAPVAEPRPLRNGDIIEVADGVALRVELSGGDDKGATQFRGCDARRMYEQIDGRIFQIIGDGIVALFNGAGSAVKSAVVWQSDIARHNAALAPARRMEFRAGINWGDLLVTPVGAAIGDAINLAARVQTIAPPGGIFITGVRDQLQGQIDFRFEFFQTTEMKKFVARGSRLPGRIWISPEWRSPCVKLR